MSRLLLSALLALPAGCTSPPHAQHPPGDGSVTLSWSRPTTNADGSTLADLAGYRIYYGHAAGEYPYMIIVDDSSSTSRVINDLASGTYYFVITAYDAAGRESEYSKVVTKQVN